MLFTLTCFQEEVVGLLKDAITAKSGDTKGFVIDGFPANLEQAKLFEDMIGAPTKIVVFEVKDEVLKIRLRERQNFDDKPESVLKRIETFTEQTRPVIKQYSSSVISVSRNLLLTYSVSPYPFLFADKCR